MTELTFELEETEYNELVTIAEREGTTIEDMITQLLKLCVKEKGLVVWKDGFDKPYTVLKTKEEVQKWMGAINYPSSKADGLEYKSKGFDEHIMC